MLFARSTLISVVVVFLLSAVAGFFLFQNRSALGMGDAIEVDWRLLGEMDYVTGKMPPELQALDGKDVKIPGFMVPLEDNQKAVTEFLLVPSPQACIHVPPPPPNQMVLINIDVAANAKVEFGPIWVMGKLSLKSKRHMYGESSFQMSGLKIEPYR